MTRREAPAGPSSTEMGCNWEMRCTAEAGIAGVRTRRVRRAEALTLTDGAVDVALSSTVFAEGRRRTDAVRCCSGDPASRSDRYRPADKRKIKTAGEAEYERPNAN